MLDELATGWSRDSVDMIAVLGRMLSRGFDPEIDYDEYQVAALRSPGSQDRVTPWKAVVMPFARS